MFWRHWELYLFLLLLANLWYFLHYHRGWGGKSGLLERALDAAEDGDTEQVLHLLKRLLRQKKAEGQYCAADLASRLVCVACEHEHPDTAEMVLYALGLRRADLVFVEEKGKPALPLLEYVSRDPQTYVHTLVFLRQEDKDS